MEKAMGEQDAFEHLLSGPPLVGAFEGPNDDFPRPLTTHKVDYARITGVLDDEPPSNPTLACSAPFSGHKLRTSQEYRVSDAKEGLKHQTSSFLLRTSLNVAPDQEA